MSLFYNQILGVLNSLFRLGFSETYILVLLTCTYCRIRFYLWQLFNSEVMNQISKLEFSALYIPFVLEIYKMDY